MRFHISTVAACLVVFASTAAAVPSSIVFQDGPTAESVRVAPLIHSPTAEIVPKEYVFVFMPEVENADAVVADIMADSLAKDPSAMSLIHSYDNGFSARIEDESVLDEIRTRPEIEFVEFNQLVSINELDTQSNPPSWGLPRIYQRDFAVTNMYKYPSTAGQNIDAYIIDTGINIAHTDFEGRAIWGLTAPSNDKDVDGNGHGTHVAATVGGAKFGVAKKVQLIAVKVLRSSGSGTTADVIKGIDWSAKKAKESKRKSVANMSLGGGSSRALDRAVELAIEGGLHFAVAAGNSNDDACRYSPAEVDTAVTVGASTKYDSRAYFSNTGKCVDVFAPGLDITSAWIGSNTATRTISGTSMASPHVCGVMALLLADKDYTPAELKSTLEQIATPDIISSIPSDTVNLLLFNQAD